jgi:hypothetical protein
MTARTIEDRLREEYFALLPDARSVLEELEAEVRHWLLPLLSELDKHEKLRVTSRIKDCESALDSLRRRQEGAIFDPNLADKYSLKSLNDLTWSSRLSFSAEPLGRGEPSFASALAICFMDVGSGSHQTE